MLTVIFVSDSTLDVFTDKALVGSNVYQSFLEYMSIFDLSPNDTLLYNDKQSLIIEAIAVADKEVKVISIGKKSKEILNDLNVPFYALPPIDETPNLQSLEFKTILGECSEFIHDYQNH
jgi:hypothetical protein